MTAEEREALLRERLETIRARSAKATSWRSSTRHLTGLVNRDGFVPVKARLSREDIAFISGARDEVLTFAELALQLLDLHRPQEAGGISSDPDRPIRRCRACMARWPCPTVRVMIEAVKP
ncbi:hypothetical protein GCM10010182_07950 [Actinomadura cremea]|nr:hypothetical protein GCM10010182_07950 [Actinomadura cremea]